MKLGGQVLVLTSRQVIATTDTKQDGFVLVDTEHAQASRCPGPGNRVSCLPDAQGVQNGSKGQ